ncbi:hypothetical protein [Acinetobacter higginsii]|uniref:hypothetical protein n=1 Tax=Acinetobacter higginsii TaxID=70347 RepID=UPI001F4A548F|nr:hypothetical protein [Acinetobacter higginsii]MCH7381374.1 hypothetical protein [Acinetobacter higginsii]
MNQESMLFRRQMRISVLDALKRAKLWIGDEQVNIDSPGDWDVQHLNSDSYLPCVLVRTTNEGKASNIKAGLPQFDTGVTIEVLCAVSATTAEKAQDTLENFWFVIENILLCSPSIINQVQNVQSVDTLFKVESSGNNHIAAVSAAFVYEGFEYFEGAINTDVLKSMGIHIDLANVFDPNGTYPNPPFPDSVAPAPRSHGPDGRDEGYLEIKLEED